MRIAIDKNSDGVIDNIIEAESLEAAAALFPSDTVLDAISAGVQIGWIKQEDGTYAAPPAPPTQYKRITRMEFVNLCRDHGGLTNISAAINDPALADFWVILQLADTIPRDSAETQAGLAGLESRGHLAENGAQSVLDAWPMG